jgi:hypothetical protein
MTTTVMITTMTTTGMTTSAANKAKDPGTTADSGCGPGNIKGFWSRSQGRDGAAGCDDPQDVVGRVGNHEVA